MPAVRSESFVDRIYEASVLPELWPGVLVEFAHLVGGEHGILVAQRDGFNRYVASSSECEALVRAHFEGFPRNERTRRLIALRHPGFVRDLDVFTVAEMEVEPVYRDFWHRHGYGVGIATTVSMLTGDTLILHAECRRERAPHNRDEVARLDALRPHFARAALLSARLEMERVNAAAKALELIGLPAAILGRNGRLLAANDLLVSMMPHVVQDRPSRLALTDPAADGLLTVAVGYLGTAPRDFAVRSIPISAREGRPPVIFHLVPIRGVANDVFVSAVAILVATPVVPKDVPTADVVQGLFDLTPAEAKLAALVAAGHRPRDAALRLGVTEETARTTLKRVLAKTGVCRQAELVGLLRGASLHSRTP